MPKLAAMLGTVIGKIIGMGVRYEQHGFELSFFTSPDCRVDRVLGTHFDENTFVLFVGNWTPDSKPLVGPLGPECKEHANLDDPKYSENGASFAAEHGGGPEEFLSPSELLES